MGGRPTEVVSLSTCLVLNGSGGGGGGGGGWAAGAGGSGGIGMMTGTTLVGSGRIVAFAVVLGGMIVFSTDLASVGFSTAFLVSFLELECLSLLSRVPLVVLCLLSLRDRCRR